MTTQTMFTPDDFFVLENACSVAITLGKGEGVRDIMAFVQAERPQSARGYVMEALHLHAGGRHEDALDLLTTSGAMQAEEDSDQAIGVHLVLLAALGRDDEAVATAQALMADEASLSDAVRYTIGSDVEKIREKRQRPN